MADIVPTPSPQDDDAGSPVPAQSHPKMNRGPNWNKLYALPAPLRTFPLPVFVPHNPISLFHLLYVWLSQKVSPPNSHLETPYQGWWSPETRSVHITDSRAIRGLWEQGFYGKGSLSRSEANWMSAQEVRNNNKGNATSEELTKQRRAARQQTKWERARKEREAIEQTLLKEAEAALEVETANNRVSISTGEERLSESDTSATVSDGGGDISVGDLKIWQSPVGPLELLSLPNSSLDLANSTSTSTLTVRNDGEMAHGSFSAIHASAAPVETLHFLALPNSRQTADIGPLENGVKHPQLINHSSIKVVENLSPNQDMSVIGLAHGSGLNGHAKRLNGHAKTAETCTESSSRVLSEAVHDSAHSDDTTNTSSFTAYGSAFPGGSPSTPKLKFQKNVRFSPTVEKNTFIKNEPPSPEHATHITTRTEDESEAIEIEEQEHFQLTLEEAFFLSYSVGALIVHNPTNGFPISIEDLFTLFRKFSYFPPLISPRLAPDDPFLLNYVVYHHFRSLGWVVRGGVKFAVDFMLYDRGPVFSHAEFAVVILPSYSDPYWLSNGFLQSYVKGKEKRTWAWFHCIHRVITQVRKTLVLVYVDIPKPWDVVLEKEIGVDGILGRYRVREVVMQRWFSNRQRD